VQLAAAFDGADLRKSAGKPVALQTLRDKLKLSPVEKFQGRQPGS
jgi:hypothetical protein